MADDIVAPPQMPEGLPTQFWDAQANQVKLPDLIKSYGEAATFKTQHDARLAALPKKPEDYKIELKLPDTVKVPQGVEYKIDEKDPRIAPLRAYALKHQLSPDAVNELVAIDAERQIAAMVQAEADLQAEQKKLGENGPARVSAVESFLKATLTQSEYEELRSFIGNATAFAGLEKVIAKATTQQVPGRTEERPLQPAPKSHAERIWSNGFQPQQKAS